MPNLNPPTDGGSTPSTDGAKTEVAGDQRPPQSVRAANAKPAQRTKFERKLGIADKIVKILAIVIGGIFAIIKFGLFDLPPLQKQFAQESSFEWRQNDAGSSSCVADLGLTLTNISKSTITIGEVRTWAWIMNTPHLANQQIQHFDLFSLADPSQAVDHFAYRDGPLVQTYAPGESSHHDFTWTVQRQKDKYAFFKIELFEAGHQEPKDWHYEWDLVCKADATQQNTTEEKTKKVGRRLH